MPSSRPGSVPLTGADCFLLAFNGEVERWCGASHLAQLVLRLGPGFDPGRLRKALDELAPHLSILRAPVRRRAGAPVYRTDLAATAPPPEVALHQAPDAHAGTGIPAPIQERLSDRFDARRGELLRFDLVRYRDGSADLGMTWLHLLFDGSGSERFLAFLDACARGERRPDALPAGDRTEDASPVAAPGPRERGRQAMRWRRSMRALAARPPRSLAGPLARTTQRLEVDLHAFTPEETARAGERAARQAGFLTPMLFYLAVALRAHHAVARSRGLDAESYVVPLPVDLRPKGAEGAIFRTRVSMLWFQVEPAQCDDFAVLLEALKRQRRDAIKAGLVEAGAFALDFARWLPSRVYARMARRDFQGELCSFFFAWTGEFAPDLLHFLGAEIRDAVHTPSVPPSPGSSLICCLRGARLRAAHIHQRGVFTPGELARFRARLRADLLGE